MDYLFYYDESYHDKKITVNENGIINILREDKSDTYVGVFIGFDKRHIDDSVDKLCCFENKYKSIFDIKEDKELKSEIIKIKQYKFGIKSFDRNAYNFYRDFFEILDNEEIIIHISYMSKIECYITKIFKEVNFKPCGNITHFYYSLIKFFYHYNDEQLFKALYDANSQTKLEEFKELLLEDLKKIICAGSGVPRKSKEVQALLNLYKTIEETELMPILDKVKFDYNQIYIGFSKMLEEMSIRLKDVKLVIDYEENTYNAACEYSFGKLKSSHSKDNIRLHFSDNLAGFVAKMILSIMKDLSSNEVKLSELHLNNNIDMESKRILNEQWFNIDCKTLDLYHIIFNVLIKKQKYNWNSKSSLFFDGVNSFYCLLEYFSQYKNIEEYKTIELNTHREKYNELCLIRMLERYKDML